MTTVAAPPVTGYSGKRSAEVVGISYRQLDYWARTDLVRPSIAEAAGSGSRRRYSYSDLVELTVVRSLLDLGVTLGVVRDVLPAMRKGDYVVIAGARLTVLGAAAGDRLDEILPPGCAAATVLSLRAVRDQLDLALL